MYRDTDVIVQNSFEVTSETVTDTSMRDIEGDMRRPSIVMVCQGQACEAMDQLQSSAFEVRRTSFVNHNIHARVIKAPAFGILGKLISSARFAQNMSSLEHDHIRLFRIFRVC